MSDDTPTTDEEQTAETTGREADGGDATPGVDGRKTTIQPTPERRDPLADDFQLGDPVVDLANGRAMVIVEKLADRVDEYDEYDLEDNYANERLRVSPADPVYGTEYVASVGSEPSGPRYGDPPYAFPSSRLGRPTIESVDGIERVYEMVARDVLERLFVEAAGDAGRYASALDDPAEVLDSIAGAALEDRDLVDEARELADVEQTIATDGGNDE